MPKKLATTTLISFLILYAQVSYSLTIGPSRFEVRLPAGETAGADYYVQNETDAPVHVVVEPENWFKEAYNYGDLDIKDWIEFDIYEFDLEPKEIKKLRLTIKVPTDVKGELVAQIFFSSAVAGTEKRAGGTIQARLGGVLYVAIKGTEIVDSEIRDLKASKIKEKENEKLKVEIPIMNKGNVHLRPSGKVLIENNAGQRMAELELLPSRSLLPNQELTYEAIWDKPTLTRGAYTLTAIVEYGKEFDDMKTATIKKVFEIDKDGEMRPK